MPWTFEQSSGALRDPNGVLVSVGYAGGECGARPDAVNNPVLQDVVNVGPLPCGAYLIEAPIEHSRLGPFALPLLPEATNEMFGRSDFYMHGDTPAPGQASDGCIIMPRAVREQVWASNDHALSVLA